MKFFATIKQNKENLQKIEALENENLLDTMTHQFERFKSVNHDLAKFYSPLYVWQKWIRR